MWRSALTSSIGEVTGLHGRWPLFVTCGLYVAGGLYLLVKGSDWLVEGASAIAAALGFSELTIGLTAMLADGGLPVVAAALHVHIPITVAVAYPTCRCFSPAM